MSEIIDVSGQHKCAYDLCRCFVPTSETYCSDYCSDADDAAEVEIQCDCKHAPCSTAGDDPLYTTPGEQEHP